MRKRIYALVLGLMLISIGRCWAETRVELSAEEARVGDVIDVTVTVPEGVEKVIYTLTRNGDAVFSGKEDEHTVVSFRPRQEGTYTLTVTALVGKKEKETAQAKVKISGSAAVQQGADVVYSQKDGWWKDKKYSSRNQLEQAGCAIFTLSHALQRMGWTGEELLPEQLAVTYANCYTEGGTANYRLLYQASEVYGFTTDEDLLKDASAIRDGLKSGDYYSFSIVIGHIALVSGLDEASNKVYIVDSAPGATFERIKNGNIYYADGENWVQARSPVDIPGARYYFETREWGGLTYAMDLSYVARRGVRLIRPGWLFYQREEGLKGVQPETFGSMLSTVWMDGEKVEVPTADLRWNGDRGGKLAVVNKKAGAKLMNAEGKKMATISACTILPILGETDNTWQVAYGEKRGYLSKKDGEIAEISSEVHTGKISLNGNTSGRAEIKVRYGCGSKEKVVDNWKTGTRVAVLKEQKGFYQVEARGKRVWVQKDYLMLDEEE